MEINTDLKIPNLLDSKFVDEQLNALLTQDENAGTEIIKLEDQLKSVLGVSGSGFQIDRLFGSSGIDTFYGNIQGATQMVGGSGSNTFYNYNASDIVQGNGTSNTLVLQDYQGNNTITLGRDATNVNAADFTVNGQTLLVGNTGNISNIQTLGVQLGSGNDTLTINPNFATLPPGLEPVMNSNRLFPMIYAMMGAESDPKSTPRRTGIPGNTVDPGLAVHNRL